MIFLPKSFDFTLDSFSVCVILKEVTRDTEIILRK